MAMSPERKLRNDPDIGPASRPVAFRPVLVDPGMPDVNVNQTGYPSRSGSSAGYFIAALVVLLGFILALYFGSRTVTVTAPVIQNSTAKTVPAPPPAATPPATTAEPAQPDTKGEQPAGSTEPGTTGSGNGTGQ